MAEWFVDARITRYRRLAERLKQWLWNDQTLEKILPHAQGRMEVLSDFVPLSGYLMSGEVAVTAEAFEGTADSSEELVSDCSSYFGDSRYSKIGSGAPCSRA